MMRIGLWGAWELYARCGTRGIMLLTILLACPTSVQHVEGMLYINVNQHKNKYFNNYINK